MSVFQGVGEPEIYPFLLQVLSAGFSLLDSSPALVSLGLLSILQVLPSSALRFSSSSDNSHQLPAGVTHWLGAFAVFLSLVEAPSHPLQPAVRHFFMDCPLTSLSFWKPGTVTHAHFLLFFFNEPLAFCLSFPSSSHHSLSFFSH